MNRVAYFVWYVYDRIVMSVELPSTVVGQVSCSSFLHLCYTADYLMYSTLDKLLEYLLNIPRNVIQFCDDISTNL